MPQRITIFERSLIPSAFALTAIVLVYFCLSFNVNWDEFFYLHYVHEYLRGELSLRLQTLYVHAFTWLPAVSNNEVDQVVAARLVMLALHGLASFFLFRIAERATDRPSALFAAFAYLCVSYVIRGGASFRADPIAAFIILAGLDLICLRERDWASAAAAGALFGTAGMVTIKSAIFLPTFVCILAVPVFVTNRRLAALQHAATWVVTAAGSFLLLYWWHGLYVTSPRARDATDIATQGFMKTLWTAGFFPGLSIFLDTLLMDFVFWGFLFAGAVVVGWRLVRLHGAERLASLEIAALAAPLGSLLIYRNSFPYFYGFLLASAAILTAVAWQALGTGWLQSYTHVRPAAVKVLAVLHLLFVLALHGVIAPHLRPLAHQRTVLDAIHRAFPEPVPYLDRASIVASFPQAGFFMSTWGMDIYRERGMHFFARAIAEHGPPLLVADHPFLDIEHKVYPADVNFGQTLFPEDRAALQMAYIHHWGPIYVAGLHANFDSPPRAAIVQIPIAGRYTLEADAPIRIDSRLTRPGESIELKRGSHELRAEAAEPMSATLRWGKKLYRPQIPAPELPLFLGF